MPAASTSFCNNLLLWAGFAVSLFIVIGSVEWPTPGPVQGFYFDRLTGSSSRPGQTGIDLAAEGIMHVGMAILFGWVAHALALVGLDILTGRNRAWSADARTVDECAARLHAAGWSVGESCFMTNASVVWQVDGTNGEERLLARAPTQAGAWRAACVQGLAAESLTVLAVTAHRY